MGLTQRDRRGVPKQQQPKGPPPLEKWPTRRQAEILIVLASSAVAVVGGIVFIREINPEQKSRMLTENPEETGETFVANAQAGEIYGKTLGRTAGEKMCAYPTTADLDSLAKTSAADAGSTVNDFVFIYAFKRGFEKGYSEGRIKGK